MENHKHKWYPGKFKSKWMPDMVIYGHRCYGCGAVKWGRIEEKKPEGAK
jgi:hypothetical protein